MTIDRRCDEQKAGKWCRHATLPRSLNDRANAFKVCKGVIAEWVGRGTCMCCGGQLGRGWCLDHDHRSGFARGIVCRRCNIAAAYFEDPDYIQVVLRYIAGEAGQRRRGEAERERRFRGTGSVHQRKRDGMWMGVVDLPPGPDGKRQRRYVSSKDREVAEQRLARLKRQIAMEKVSVTTRSLGPRACDEPASDVDAVNIEAS